MVLIYNAFVRSWQRVGEAWSGIEVQLKRRANLIPNLVETVRAYASHERRLFQEITEARSSLQQAKSPGPSARANMELSLVLGRLLAVAENYPQLRASENFKELQQELFDIEEKIAYARHFYNRITQDYNTRIASFPSLILARLCRFQAAEYFDADAEVGETISVLFRDVKDQ